jgi:ribosomal-protein-alanine N-acetyltransferase
MKIFAETERLILREILPQDEKGLYLLDSDSEVHRYLGNNPINSVDESRNTIDFIRQQYINNGIGRWAVIKKDNNEFIGWSGFKLITEITNNHINYYDLGYRFIKDHWGNGYAIEAANASLNYAFSHLNLHEVFAIADVRNLGSRKVLEKAGLKIKNTFIYQGQQHFWFNILQDEWVKKRNTLKRD